jgi:hypothetical protein
LASPHDKLIWLDLEKVLHLHFSYYFSKAKLFWLRFFISAFVSRLLEAEETRWRFFSEAKYYLKGDVKEETLVLLCVMALNV